MKEQCSIWDNKFHTYLEYNRFIDFTKQNLKKKYTIDHN